MQNPQMPHIPGVGAVADTLDFVKNLWGSMNVPGMSIPGFGAPALSVDDLDKKIADLKAVESWLNVNLSMLHGTIQALEIQRGTLATLKTMGASMAEAMKQPGADQKSVLAATPFASAFFSQPAAAPEAAKAEPEPAKAAAPDASAPASSTPFMPDPTMWWNVLQDQFKQAVTGAMSSDAMSNATAMAQEAATMMSTPPAKAAAKPSVKPAGADAKGAAAKPRAAPAKTAKPGKG
ncbi:MAG: hypothetical protein QFF03_23325 [Pseudomonadota bacterium]|nr:hypothetical protein [Pseudomonadota bacterium]